MKKFGKVTILILVLAYPFATGWGQKKDVLKTFEDLQQVIISVSNSVKNSVVHIEVVQKVDDRKFKVMGSGVVTHEDGYILTNEHVVDNAQQIMVTLPSKREYPADLIGVDKQTDLAVIKVNTPEKLTLSKLGNSDLTKVGEWVIAVGNPYGFDRTVSFGIVSGKGRVMPTFGREVPFVNDFLQTDAAIDPGSSGGPLVNLKGEVIGINSMGLGRGQGFTIPINMAKEVEKKVIASGTIERGWIGVVIQPFNREFARYFGETELSGVLIADVLEGSPAEKAGLKAGDIVLAVGKNEIAAEKEDDLNAFSLMISETPVGEPIELKVRRGKEEKKLVLNVGSQPKVKPEEFETGLGFTVKEITEGLYRQYALPNKLGVLVSFVEVGGAAFQGKLSEGDVIVKVEDSEVTDPPSLKAALEKHSKKSQLLLRVVRGKDRVFVLIPGSKQKAEK